MFLVAACALYIRLSGIFTSKKCYALLLAVGSCLVLPAQAVPIVIDQAQVLVSVAGSAERSLVQLPYNWDRIHQGAPGLATFEAAFDLAGEPSEPYAVYFPRIGNRFEVWLNGTVLTRNGSLQEANSSDYGKAPRYIAIPPQLLQKTNLFRIELATDSGRRGGLSAITLGPESEVRPLYTADYRWRTATPLALGIACLVFGVVAMLLWLSRVDALYTAMPRRDPIYFFAGLMQITWALRLFDFVIEQPVLAWPLWGIFEVTLSGATNSAGIVFTLLAIEWPRQPMRKYLVWFVGSCFVVLISTAVWGLLMQQPELRRVVISIMVLGMCAVNLCCIWAYFDNKTRIRLQMMLVNLVVLAAAFVDWWASKIRGDFYGNASYSRLGLLLFAFILIYILVTRFRASSVQAHDLMHTLEGRVALKEAQLQASYHQLELLAREQERTQERTRILRDMHDGVGSHISAAIRQLQSGKATDGEVLVTLRDSLDQLKLSIDSINLPVGDVTALLANMRYRLEPRFTSSGIAFGWDVDLLPVIARLDHAAMRQLQYMVFEALSNALQHAQATHLRVEALVKDNTAVLRIIDNGRGFDVATATSRGLASMRERAAAIGAALHISSAASGTCVEIAL